MNLLIFFLLIHTIEFNVDLSSHHIQNLSQASHIGNDIFVLAGVYNEHFLHIYDARNDSIVKSLIGNGDGPREARGVASFNTCEDAGLRSYVVMSTTGKALFFDKEFDFIEEIQTRYVNVSSIQCIGNELIISFGTIFNNSQLNTLHELSVGVVYNYTENVDIRQIILPSTIVYLTDNIKNLKNVQIFRVDTYIRYYKNNYFIFLRGAPAHYIMSDTGEYTVVRYSDPIVSNLGHQLIERFGHYGHRPGPVHRNITFHNEFIYTAFGNSSENIPYGLIQISANSPEDYKVSIFNFSDYFLVPSEYFTFLQGESTIILYPGLTFPESNFLYVVR